MVKPHFPFHHPQIEAVLSREHTAADSDKWKLIPRLPAYFFASLSGRVNDLAFRRRVFSDVYSAVTPERGALLYLIARAIQATRIVEFGTSLGISTIYLATAVRDNLAAGAPGPGEVAGSEMDPRKIEVATRNLQEAGLADLVRILPGDALETLLDIEAPLDMVFLDGGKDMYLAVLKMLQPKLRGGAVVISDNIETFRRELIPFLDYLHSEMSGFITSTLKISDGMEISLLEKSGA